MKHNMKEVHLLWSKNLYLEEKTLMLNSGTPNRCKVHSNNEHGFKGLEPKLRYSCV
jgi:hypothetical protein